MEPPDDDEDDDDDALDVMAGAHADDGNVDGADDDDDGDDVAEEAAELTVVLDCKQPILALGSGPATRAAGDRTSPVGPLLLSGQRVSLALYNGEWCKSLRCEIPGASWAFMLGEYEFGAEVRGTSLEDSLVRDEWLSGTECRLCTA